MKKMVYFLIFSLFLGVFALSLGSCSKKTGCPINENVHVKPNKKGNLPKKRGKSNLFPKNMRG